MSLLPGNNPGVNVEASIGRYERVIGDLTAAALARVPGFGCPKHVRIV